MPASHQNIKLSPGRHRTPDDGACVMELASLLAGEPFSDRPASVCPVIAAFLRSYNDHADDTARQGLYRCAALAIGTQADAETERRRAKRCLDWARATCSPPPLRVRILHRLLKAQGPDVDGVYAARAAVATAQPGTHARVLALVDELVALWRPRVAGPEHRRRRVSQPSSDTSPRTGGTFARIRA